jgi:hypothetical protein
LQMLGTLSGLVLTEDPRWHRASLTHGGRAGPTEPHREFAVQRLARAPVCGSPSWADWGRHGKAMCRAPDRRAEFAQHLDYKTTQQLLCRDATRCGALLSSELASRASPRDIIATTVYCSRWPTPVAVIHFLSELTARQWACHLIARLPPTEHGPTPWWRLEVSTARIRRTNPAASLSPWHPIPGELLAVLAVGCRGPARAHPGNGQEPSAQPPGAQPPG